MVFTLLAMLQRGNALALRSDRQTILRLGLRGNPFLIAVLATTFLVQLVLVYSPFAQSILSTEPLDAVDLAIVLIASTALFWIVEVQKWIARRRRTTGGLQLRQGMYAAS